MREILFRGKLKDFQNKWIEGDVSFKRDGTPYIRSWGDDGYMPHEIIPETLGQYTGLTDKNGKKIFESDILDYINDDGELIGCPCVVRFGEYNCSCCDGVYGWFFDGGCGDIRDFAGCEECGPYQVVGNIHDNPELLEVNK